MAEIKKPPVVVLSDEQETKMIDALKMMEKGSELAKGMEEMGEDVSTEKETIDNLIKFNKDFLKMFGKKKLIK